MTPVSFPAPAALPGGRVRPNGFRSRRFARPSAPALALALVLLWGPPAGPAVGQDLLPGDGAAPRLASKKESAAAGVRARFYGRKYKRKRKPARGSGIRPRIVGGKDATAGAYPWMAALVFSDDPNLFTGQFCAGALVHPYWVVTAAHCVIDQRPGDFEVVLGVRDLADANAVQRVGVVEVIIHPGYRDSTLDADIALVRLAEPAAPDHTPIPVIDDLSLEAAGTLVRLLGWGDTTPGQGEFPTVLQEVDIPIVSREFANGPGIFDGELTENMMPAGFAEGGKDSCAADSGGPAASPAPVGPGWVLAGIISFGDEDCAAAGTYGVNTRVSSFRPFLMEHLHPSYAAWELGQGVVGELRDPDADGRTNFVEFALRSDPLGPGAPPPEVTFFSEGGGPPQPALRLALPASAGEVDYRLEASVDLQTWESFDFAATVVERTPVPGDPTGEWVTAAPPPLPGSDRQLFLRARAAPSGALVSGVRTLLAPGRAGGSLTPMDARHPQLGGRFAKSYRLEGVTAAEPLTIVGRSVNFDLQLELLDGAGGEVLVTVAFDGAIGGTGTDERLDFTPAAGIDYFVRVSSETDGATGAYDVGVYERVRYEALPVFSIPSSRGGTLTAADPLDPVWLPREFYSVDFRLGPTAGGPVEFTLSSGQFDAYLEILNAETGVVVVDDDDSAGGFNARASLTPVEGVAYILRVTSATERATGSFTLEAGLGSDSIGVPQSLVGSLSAADRRDPFNPRAFVDDYALTGVSAGQEVAVVMTSSQFDTFLFLVDASNGTILAADDDSGGGTNAALVFVVQPGVNYIVRATSLGDGETGSYALSTSR